MNHLIINQYGIKKTKQKVRAFKIRVKGKAYRKVKIARKMKGVSRGQNDEQSCLYIMMTHEIKGHTSHAEAVIPTEQLDKFEKKKKKKNLFLIAHMNMIMTVSSILSLYIILQLCLCGHSADA